MIIRRAIWQHGRRVARAANFLDSNIRRPLSTASPDTDRLDAFLQRKAQEGNSAEAPSSDETHPVARNFLTFKKQQQLYSQIGSSITPHYEPHSLVNNPPSPSDVTLELLLASEAHFGHSTSLWNPMNARYIFGIRQGIHIISLEATASHLRRACRVVTDISQRGGLVLFVGTRDGQERCVVKAAELSGGCHLFEKWVPGSITNSTQILRRCRMKVVDEFDQEVTGFEDQLRDRVAVRPDLVVCLNPLENQVLLRECSTNQIPSIGIIDTDADPTLVTYPIPANDDSLRCTQLIGGVLGRAAEEGRRQRLKAAAKQMITFLPAEGLELPGQQGEGARGQSASISDLGLRTRD